MATVDKAFADNLIKHGGWTDDNDHDAPDNPQCVRITKYTDMGGKDAYGAVFAHERDLDKYNHPSPYIRNPEIYWEPSDGVAPRKKEPRTTQGGIANAGVGTLSTAWGGGD